MFLKVTICSRFILHALLDLQYKRKWVKSTSYGHAINLLDYFQTLATQLQVNCQLELCFSHVIEDKQFKLT